MIYRSNLTCPDLSSYFKLKDPPLQQCGHDAPSDPDFEPECGYWTHDEAAILFNVATQVQGCWIDVGARFGWTGMHLAVAGCDPILVDPHFANLMRVNRMAENWHRRFTELPDFSWALFAHADFGNILPYGAVIDGCHSEPAPLEDAMKAMSLGAQVILFHDTWGKPVHDGINYLIDAGYHCRMYDTPNGVALCWSDELHRFRPPFHVADPAIEWSWKRKCSGFDYSRCV